MSTNEELAISARGGDPEALAELYEQCRTFINRQAQKYALLCPGCFDVDDLRQQGFFAVLAACKSFTAEGGAAFTTYLQRPLYWQFEAAARRRGSRQKNDLFHFATRLEAPLTNGDDCDLANLIEDEAGEQRLEEIEREELREAVRIALEALSPAERELIHLRYWNGLAQSEAAQALNVTVAEARKLERAALRKLRHPSISETLKSFFG